MNSVAELYLIFCVVGFVLIIARFLFSVAREAFTARFPKAARYVAENYRYWLIGVYLVAFCSGGFALLLVI